VFSQRARRDSNPQPSDPQEGAAVPAGRSCPSGVQPQRLKVTRVSYSLAAVGLSRRSQSCASRAKSCAKFARYTKGFSARRRSKRLAQIQKVSALATRLAAQMRPAPSHGSAYHDGRGVPPPADDRLLRQSGRLLAELAARHGITSMHLGLHPAEVVVTLEADRTYFDLVDFQGEAEALLGHRVAVTSAAAPDAHRREQCAPARAA
jgi:hypothetical protein